MEKSNPKLKQPYRFPTRYRKVIEYTSVKSPRSLKLLIDTMSLKLLSHYIPATYFIFSPT